MTRGAEDISVQKLDLRGLACPEPVLRTKRFFDNQDVLRVEALVDDEICVNNLKRLARTLKATIEVNEKRGFISVVLDRSQDKTSHGGEAEGSASYSTAKQNGPLPEEDPTQKGVVIFIAKDTFGDGDPEFSRTLLNLFLQTVQSSGHRPSAILMANSGVKLMAKDSPLAKVIKDFQDDGCEVLACGLCLEFYGLKDGVDPKQITNMFAITEYLFAAQKVLTP